MIFFNWWHNFSPQPILFSFGLINIYWYGLLLALAVLAGLAVAIKLGQRAGLPSETWYDLTFYLLLFGILGARVWEVLFVSLPYYWQNPSEIIKIWHGGLAIHGGIAAGIIVLIIFARRRHLNFWLLADICAVAIALGQAIGRWGNFFNQELFGYPTEAPWGIFIAPENRPEMFANFSYFHPTFLYESLICFLLIIFLWRQLFYQRRSGNVALLYLMLYSAARFGLEFLRLDATPEYGGWRLPQLVSLVIFAAAAFWLWHRRQNAIIETT